MELIRNSRYFSPRGNSWRNGGCLIPECSLSVGAHGPCVETLEDISRPATSNVKQIAFVGCGGTALLSKPLSFISAPLVSRLNGVFEQGKKKSMKSLMTRILC